MSKKLIKIMALPLIFSLVCLQLSCKKLDEADISNTDTTAIMTEAFSTTLLPMPSVDGFNASEFYTYESYELDLEIEGCDETYYRYSVFGSDYYASVIFGTNAEIRQAEEIFDEETFYETSTVGLMPVDENGNVCVMRKLLRIFDFEGNVVASVDLDEVQGYSYKYPLIQVDREDNIHVIVCNGNNETRTENFYDLKFDSTGNLLSNTKLSIESGNHLSIVHYDTERIYVWTSDEFFTEHIFELDLEGNLISEAIWSGICPEAVFSRNGELHIVDSMFDEDTSGFRVVLRTLSDHLERNEANDILLPDNMVDVRCIFYIEECDGILYKDAMESNRILFYGITDGSEYEVINFLDEPCLCIPTKFVVNDNGQIIFYGDDAIMSGRLLCVATPTEVDPYANREIITLAGVGIDSDPIFTYLIKDFNINNDEYYIETIDYGSGYLDYSEEYYEALPLLQQELLDSVALSHISGEGPDIIVSTGEISFGELISSEYLIDLTDYVEEDLSNSLVPWFYEVAGDEIYSIFTNYYIDTVLIDGSENDVENLDNIDYSSYNEIASQSGYDGMSWSGFEEKTAFLEYIFEYRINEFFNIDTGEVRFNSPEFINMLEWINYNHYSEWIGVAPGNNSFASFDLMISGIGLFYDKPYLAWENITHIGIPTSDESIIGARPNYTFAITTDCNCPDEAWEFIRRGFDSDMQEVFSRVSFPVLSSELDECWNTQTSEYMDDPRYDTCRDLYYDIVNSINSIRIVNDEVTTIVLEEANAYFYGDRTALEVAEYIQDRASTVMSERYG